MTDIEKLWQIVLSEVETEVSKPNFLTLFKATKLLSLENETAIIAAPSAMIINMLKTRYSRLLQNILKKHTQGTYQLQFVPKTTNAAKEGKIGPLFVTIEQPPKILGHLPRVRPDYTFQTLAVSSTNQLAVIAAQTVAKNIGGAYNPLVLYGPVGVGKTHLMQAIANFVFAKDPDKKIVYITSEEFTNEVVEAIRTNNTAKMKKRFRSVHLLIIDDVQFIAGKDRVQEELFHTFNILIDNGAQIVLSSDRPPQDIKKLEKRLSSRFSGGLTVDIEAPDFELKTAILLIKAKKYAVLLPMEAAKTIAEAVEDTRSLEGMLLRVITASQAAASPITQALVEQTIQGKKEERISHFHADDIIKNVCSFYNMKTTQLKGPKRDASLVKARQIAMYLLKKELGLPLVEIGNILGGRDHTTVIHGIGKIENQLSTKPQLASEIMGITKAFEQ